MAGLILPSHFLSSRMEISPPSVDFRFEMLDGGVRRSARASRRRILDLRFTSQMNLGAGTRV
jgi:hypothetical protein